MKERKEISKEKKDFFVQRLDKRSRNMLLYIKPVVIVKKISKKLVFW